MSPRRGVPAPANAPAGGAPAGGADDPVADDPVADDPVADDPVADDPVAVVRRWYATSDPALLADDVVWGVLPAWPAGGEYRGRRAVLDEFFPALRAPFAAYAAEPAELLVVSAPAAGAATGSATGAPARSAPPDATVVALGHYRGRVAGPNGAAFESAFAHVWRVRRGRIARFDQIADTAAVADALAAGSRALTDGGAGRGPASGGRPVGG